MIPPRAEKPPRPWRPHWTVNLDRVESVEQAKGTILVVARRRGREYLINLPRDEALTLAAKLRPAGRKRRP